MASCRAVALVPHPPDRKVVVDDEQASRPQHAYSPAVVLADAGDSYRDMDARVEILNNEIYRKAWTTL